MQYSEPDSSFIGLWVIGIYFAQGAYYVYLIFRHKLIHFSVILCIRTWAVWLRSRWIGIGLGVFMFGTFIVQCYYLVEVTGSSVRGNSRSSALGFSSC